MNSITLPSILIIRQLSPHVLYIEGPLGSITMNLAKLDPDGMCFMKYSSSYIHVLTHCSSRRARARLQTLASLLEQSIEGVTKGWVVSLSLVGVGFRVEKVGSVLDFKLGQSHPLHYTIPSDVQVVCVKPTQLTIYGVEKGRVTQVAARIRALKPAEVYKGKGIRYLNEVVHLKEGKKK
jgi:large subunit ribosomal protein L6